MSKVPYIKPALPYADQLAQLKSRGLTIESDAKALHLLEAVSYYRLSGYWYPMLQDPKSTHVFKPSSSFNTAFKLYCFDREFRKLILAEIEKIEIAIRAKMIYILSQSHGSFWFHDSHLFIDPVVFSNAVSQLGNEFKRSDEQFIKSFKNKYTDPLPPSWMMLEISSFGNLSYLYQNLKPGRDKRAIANHFGLDETTFSSWIHCIVYVRNVCAHHTRLWNRVMSISPKIPLTPANPWLTITTIPHTITGAPISLNNRSYFLISMILYLLNTVNPTHIFKTKLQTLLATYPDVDVKSMGFPINWETEPLWI